MLKSGSWSLNFGAVDFPRLAPKIETLSDIKHEQKTEGKTRICRLSLLRWVEK